MTTTSLTASIGGTIYPVKNTSVGLGDKVDARSTLNLTIYDATNSYQFQFGQPVAVTDSLEGVKFTGFVQKPVEQKIAAQNAKWITISCMDNHFLADTISSNDTFTNEYAGIAAAYMANKYLAPRGVTANYALRRDVAQSDFATGTLSNTAATANNGGDLELAAAGSAVTFSQATQADFNFVGVVSGNVDFPSSGGITLAPTSAIKLTATQGIPGLGSAYLYVKIWSGSYTIASSDTFNFTVWIPDTAPQKMASVEFVCSDGTSFSASQATIGTDVQGVGPAITNDLSGLATNTWYVRRFFIDAGGAWVGKTISYVAVAFGGKSTGSYTAYFQNISITNGASTKLTVFSTNATSTSIVPQQLQNSGYSSLSCTVVTTYPTSGFCFSHSCDLTSAGIAQSSYVNWSATLQSVVNGVVTQSALTNSVSLLVTASVDTVHGGGINTFLPCTQNGAIPGLLPGANLPGKQFFLSYIFTNTGNDPTVTPFLSSVSAGINPAYACTKSDSITTYQTQTQWNTGTLTNLLATSGNTLQLNGYARNWDNADYSNQTLYGTTSPAQGVLTKQFYLTSGTGTDVRSRLDFIGSAWQNFTVEIDVVLGPANTQSGIVYRTTGWQNNNNTFAYACIVQTTGLVLGYGTNSSSGGGSFTNVTGGVASITLTAGTTYHIKLVINGNSHKVYLNDVLYINATDSTYTAAGYVGLRYYNNTGSTSTGILDNFGIVASLSGTWVSPAIDISSLGTISNSAINLEIDPAVNTTLCTFLAEISLNNGSTYTALTNDVMTPGYYQSTPVTGLTAGTNVSSYTQVKIRLTITASTASTGAVMPDLTAITLFIIGAYSSTGTRITPVLYLANAGRAGSTLAAYNATIPTNTTVALATSTDGTSWTTVANGSQISGITSQPTATLDTFDASSTSNYTSTNRTGGATGTWVQDTINSLLTVSGGTNAQLLYSSISCKDADIILDLDQADCVGLVWRVQDASNFYELDIFDGSSSAGSTNAVKLYKVASNVKTQLGSTATPTLARGTKYRVRVTMIGTAITVYVDGVSQISLTDSALAGPGEIGISEVSGVGRFYNFRIQPLGDDLTGKKAYARLTLTSTDPTATPQITNLTLAALGPNIGLGSLVTVDYRKTLLAANYDDLATRSNSYYWLIDQNLSFIFNDRVAAPAPYILQSNDQMILLNGPLTVERSGDLYRNRHTVTGVLDGNGGTTGIVTVDNTNLAGTVTQAGFAQIMGRSIAVQVVLNQASATLTTSGDFGDLDVSQCARIALDINITAVSSATITFFVDRKGSDGVYYPIWQSSTINATGQLSTAIGAGTAYQQSLGATIRLRYTITGTSVTLSASILGRLTVQSAGLGVVEVIEDVSSQNMDSTTATAYCTAQLQRYGTIGRTLKLSTRRSNPSLAIGQYVPVFFPEHGLNDASMLITGIDTTQKIVADGSGGVTQEYRQSVTATENANQQNIWKLLASTIQ